MIIFYQDRLGTNIGEGLNKKELFARSSVYDWNAGIKERQQHYQSDYYITCAKRDPACPLACPPVSSCLPACSCLLVPACLPPRARGQRLFMAVCLAG
jgi:hypothetical protein